MINGISDRTRNSPRRSRRSGAARRVCPQNPQKLLLERLDRIEACLRRLEIQGQDAPSVQPSVSQSEKPALLTTENAARRLGVSQTTVYRLVANGRLKSVHIGTGRGAVRIAPAAIDEYLERQTREQCEGRYKTRPPRLRLKHIKVRH